MKRSLKISALVLAFGFGGNMAAAAIDTAALIEELRSQGYEFFEVKAGASTLTIEAVGGGQKIELTYDALTGLLLRQEVDVADDNGQLSQGGSSDGDDDGDDDHDDEDEGDDDEDEGDDDEGDDDEGDDDEGDDDEGDDDDDDGDDDEGDDDH